MKPTKDNIKDELCYCGALKSEHDGLDGHGSCDKTDCKQFTWKDFIFKTKNEIKNPRKYAIMKGGCIVQFSESDNITFTKETAQRMAKTLGGKVVNIQITECEELLKKKNRMKTKKQIIDAIEDTKKSMKKHPENNVRNRGAIDAFQWVIT